LNVMEMLPEECYLLCVEAFSSMAGLEVFAEGIAECCLPRTDQTRYRYE
jgi:hypothetical protein